jgi:hypothetical protein
MEKFKIKNLEVIVFTEGQFCEMFITNNKNEDVYSARVNRNDNYENRAKFVIELYNL